MDPVIPMGQWESNSLGLLRKRLAHLSPDRQEELFGRLAQYPDVSKEILDDETKFKKIDGDWFTYTQTGG